MSTTDSVNHTPAFKISTAGSDQFSIQDQINLASDLDGQDHSSGKGLAVKRVASGILASRPAAGHPGHVYVDTTWGGFAHDEGTAWRTHMMSIETNAVLVATASVTLAGYTGSIPTIFNHLMGELYVRTTTATFLESLNFYINGDSGNNYDVNYISNQAASSVTDQQSNAYGIVGGVVGANGTANRYAHLTFHIPYYQSAGHKVITFQSSAPSRTVAGSFSTASGGNVWKSTSAVTSITFFSGGGGNIDAGSMLTLYGLP